MKSKDEIGPPIAPTEKLAPGNLVNIRRAEMNLIKAISVPIYKRLSLYEMNKGHRFTIVTYDVVGITLKCAFCHYQVHIEIPELHGIQDAQFGDFRCQDVESEELLNATVNRYRRDTLQRSVLIEPG